MTPLRDSLAEWAALAALAVLTLLAALSVSLPGVAMTHVAGGLSAARNDGVWVVTAYLAGTAVAAPLAGALAARVGLRRACLLAAAVFSLAAAACGEAASIGQMALFRAVQGAAGGALVPLAQAALAQAPAVGRGLALSAFSTALLVGPSAGPALGGWAAEACGWRWLFTGPAVAGFLCVPVLTMGLPAGARRARPGRFDWPGAALLAVGVAALEVVLAKGQEWDWFGSERVVALSAVSAVALTLAAARCLTAAAPAVRLDLLADRRLLAPAVVGFALTAAYLGGLSTVSKLLQGLMGYTAGAVGELTAPTTVILVALAPALAYAAARADFRWPAAAGLVVSAAGCFWLARGNLLVAPEQVFWPRAVLVVGAALALGGANAHALRGVPDAVKADAAGVYNLLRNLGGSVGVCLAQAVLDRRGQAHTVRLTDHGLDPLNPAVAEWLARSAAGFLPGPAAGDAAAARLLALKALDGLRRQQAQALAHYDCVLLCGAAALALLPVAIWLGRRRGPPGS